MERFIIVIIACSLLFGGCSSNTQIESTKEPAGSDVGTSEEVSNKKDDENEDEIEDEKQEDKEHHSDNKKNDHSEVLTTDLKNIAEGKKVTIDNAHIFFESTFKDTIRIFGLANDTGYYNGAYYEFYDDLTLLSLGDTEDDLIEFVSLRGDWETFGVKIGDSYDTVVKILGKPEDYFYSEYEDESWIAKYNKGNFAIIVYLGDNKEGPVLAVHFNLNIDEY